ncbi:putative RNA-directed DNA polymerase [Helianthus annuus]|nr:putative RNA-directed DNA polymerase [Helianthus annuus]
MNTHLEVNTLNFFDLYDNIETQQSGIPYDEERDASTAESLPHQSQQPETQTVPSRGMAEFQQPRSRDGESGRVEGVSEDCVEAINSEGTSSALESRSVNRRSSRVTNMPKRFEDYVVDGKVKYGIEKFVNYSKLSIENKCFATCLNKSIEPRSFNEAVKDPNWVTAMNDEIEALNRNGTWDLVHLPKGRSLVGCKWIYKIKYKSSGEIERFKARLVAKGYSQKEGVDFDETFAPVVKMVTIRCVLSLAVQNDWKLFQLDINNAFLYGDLHEDVYMSLPEGYYSKDESRVCKLKKSLYGLKQAPRMWNEKLVKVLIDFGFVQSMCDYSMFVKNNNNTVVILLVYVDDIVLTGNSLDEITKVKKALKSNFLIKDLGELKYFLGIEVIKDKNGICLSQRKYCMELLSEYGMLGCKPSNCPIEQNHVVANICKEKHQLLLNVTFYQKLVGKLIYLSHTRPDIAYGVHFLSQHMHSPTVGHLEIAYKLLRYLKKSPGKGIMFKRNISFDMQAYADSDWGKSVTESRKSVTGFCVFLGNNLVSWKSKKQSTVSRSSAEAEYRALCAVACEVLWLINILSELSVNVNLPVCLFCDSSAALSIAANPVFHDRTKHFELDLFFLREKISKGILKPVGINSEDQIADVFTKGMLATQHDFLCEKLNMQDCFSH